MTDDAEFRWLSLSELRERTSIKWRVFGPDVLPLWVAEMDSALAPAVVRALHDAVARGDTGYPGGSDYAEALAEFASARWGWDGLSVVRSRLVPDVMLGVVEVVKLVTGPGDAVVVTPPVYGPFFAFVSHADRQVVEAPLGADGRLDLDALGAAFEKATSIGQRAAFLLCNPHNPTGVAHTRTELEQVAALAREHGVRVVADEIHAPLVLGGATFTPILSVAGAEDALAVTSASKAFNLAGLKAAVALAGPEAAADLERMPEEVGHGASHVAVQAHVAALREGGAWLDVLLRELDANRLLLGELVGEHLPGARYQVPQATYLGWVDCREMGLPADDAEAGLNVTSHVAGPAKFFLQRAKVALSAGHTYGTGGVGHVRVNYATSQEILREAFEALGAAVRERAPER